VDFVTFLLFLATLSQHAELLQINYLNFFMEQFSNCLHIIQHPNKFSMKHPEILYGGNA